MKIILVLLYLHTVFSLESVLKLPILPVFVSVRQQVQNSDSPGENIKNVLKHKNDLSELNYNSLINKMNRHKISKIYFTNTMDTVISEDVDKQDYSITKINPFVTTSIVESTQKNNVQTYFLQQPILPPLELITRNLFGFAENYIIPFIFLSFIIRLFTSQVLSGMPKLPGNNDIKLDKQNMIKANISLSSFGGSQEIFEECTEVVSYLKNNTIYKLAGAEIPRGILLEGPPGTGKTLLAKVIASEADANFISISASEFVELFVGMGAAKIRSLFKKARENKPCIIFIDEIDAVGKQRGGNAFAVNDEREQTLNQLLAEMDGFADNEGLLIMAATNRKDTLDAALLRPGRFDRIIKVPLPDKEARKEIFKVHSKNKNLSKEINTNLISELTSGFSGAQIKNLLNEAAIFAARQGSSIISEEDILNALDKLLVGIVKKNDTRSDESKYRIAVHETGHALLAAMFTNYFELKKVSMQSTYNGAGGYTIFNENSNITESGLYTKDLFKKRLIVGLGGKAAESIFYGDDFISVGAVQDLKECNKLAQGMIGNYGMGKELQVFYNENNNYSDKTKETFDKESLELVNEAYNEAKKLLLDNKKKMDTIVNLLNSKNILYGKEVYGLMYMP